jgi:hypothetical protein
VNPFGTLGFELLGLRARVVAVGGLAGGVALGEADDFAVF